MARLSQRVLEMQESPIRKLDGLVRQQKDVRFVPLNIGQPDVPTPEPLLRAIREFQPTVVAYGPAPGLHVAREAVAQYYQRWAPGLAPEDVIITQGGSEGLLFSMAAICDHGDEILVPEPYYTNYNGFATVVGAKIRPIRTQLSERFALPDDRTLDSFVTERTRAILFSNPGNPTGAVYGRNELDRVARWAAGRGLYVVADEVYRRIWFGDAPTSALELEGLQESVLVVDSLSKTWSACGVRIGFLISRNRPLIERIERLGQARLGAQPLGQYVAMAALGMPDSYYEENRVVYKARVGAMIDALEQIPGVASYRPDGAFYTMVGLPVDDADRFARYLVSEFRSEGESLVVAPGSGFYADPRSGQKEIRLAAVVDEDRIRRGIEILGLALSSYNRA